MTMNNSPFLQGVCDASVITITYFAVSFAFGVAAINYGFSSWEALFLSSSMYAGAGQFLVIALLSSGSSLWIAAGTVIALDLRHMLYGPALHALIPQPLQLKTTLVWAAGLTDEVFARALVKLSQRQQTWSEAWMLGLSISAWLSWVFGTLIGALCAQQVHLMPKFLQASLDFLLPALFLGFLLEVFQKKQLLIVISASLASAIGCIYGSLSMAIVLGIVAGMLSAVLQS
jgi:predicted branched-subunit amino acid permease